MSIQNGFRPVNLILDSDTSTRGADTFILSFVRVEKQMRRLVTHLVYQFPCFDQPKELRVILAKSGSVNFEGTMRGFNAIYEKSIAELVGPDHDSLLIDLRAARKIRNKLFHGQITETYVSTDALIKHSANMRKWCSLLATSAFNEIGYDGLSDSYSKSTKTNILGQFKKDIKINSL